METSPSTGSLSGGSNHPMKEVYTGIFEAGICNVLGQTSVLSRVKNILWSEMKEKFLSWEEMESLLKGLANINWFTSHSS